MSAASGAERKFETQLTTATVNERKESGMDDPEERRRERKPATERNVELSLVASGPDRHSLTLRRT